MQAGSVQALGSAPGFPVEGHCAKAGARTRPLLHLALSFQLKITAVPGPLLSLILGSLSTEDPAGPSPRPMAKPRLARGLLRKESKEPCPRGEGGPSAGTRP